MILRSPTNFQAFAGFWSVLLTRVVGLGNPAVEGPGSDALPRTSNPGGGMYRGLRPLILGGFPGCMGGVWQPPAVSFWLGGDPHSPSAARGVSIVSPVTRRFV